LTIEEEGIDSEKCEKRFLYIKNTITANGVECQGDTNGFIA